MVDVPKAKEIFNPTNSDLGREIFPLINNGYDVLLEKTADMTLLIRPIPKPHLKESI